MIAHLIKKDLRKSWLVTLMFVLFCVLVCALVFDSEVLGESDYLNTSAMNMAGILLNMLVFGNLMNVEKYEEKHNAYKMMAPLPVSARELVSGKFFVVLLSAVCGIFGVAAIYSIFGIGGAWSALRIRYLLFSGSVSLVLAGLCYLGVFRYGYHKIRAAVMGVYIVALLTPQLASFLQLVGEKENYQTAIGEASVPVVVGWVTAAVCLYAACFYASVRAKESREI